MSRHGCSWYSLTEWNEGNLGVNSKTDLVVLEYLVYRVDLVTVLVRVV